MPATFRLKYMYICIYCYTSINSLCYAYTFDHYFFFVTWEQLSGLVRRFLGSGLALFYSRQAKQLQRQKDGGERKVGSILMKPKQKSQEALQHFYLSYPIASSTLQMHELLKQHTINGCLCTRSLHSWSPCWQCGQCADICLRKKSILCLVMTNLKHYKQERRIMEAILGSVHTFLQLVLGFQYFL